MPKSKSGSPKKGSGSPKKGSGSPKKEKNSPKKGSDKGSSKKDKNAPPAELTEEEILKIPVTHVIFDLDGTILDSVTAFEFFINELIVPYERHLPVLVLQKVQNRRLDNAAKIILKELSLPLTHKEFLDHYNERFPEILRGVDLKPGVAKILDYFWKHKIPMAVVTDSNELNFHFKTDRHKLLFKKFSHIVCYETDPEAGRCRPDPRIYEIAAARFKDNPPEHSYNVLVFENSWAGVDAALAAKMRCVWVPDSRLDVSLHNFSRHLQVIPSLAHFQPQLWRLSYASNLYSISDPAIIYDPPAAAATNTTP